MVRRLSFILAVGIVALLLLLSSHATSNVLTLPDREILFRRSANLRHPPVGTRTPFRKEHGKPVGSATDGAKSPVEAVGRLGLAWPPPTPGAQPDDRHASITALLPAQLLPATQDVTFPIVVHPASQSSRASPAPE